MSLKNIHFFLFLFIRTFLGRDNSGKRKYFNETFKGKRKDAQALEVKKKNEMNNGISIEHSKLSLDEYLDKWLAISAKGRLKERTYLDYIEYLKRYVRPKIGRMKLSKIKPLDIQTVYAWMLERKLSPRTVQYTHSIMSSAMKQAVRWQIIPYNPATMTDRPQNHRKEMSVLTPEESIKFLGVAKEDKFGIIFAVALTTGMRPEEYLGLRWKNVDLIEGRVTVERVLVHKRVGGGWTLEEPKTPQSRRTIPLPQTVLNDLKAHRKKQLEERFQLGTAYQNLDFVFATEIGTPILQSNLTRRHFKPILKKAGLSEKIRPYDLRHTCATLLLAAGVNPKVVSERLGHASIVITLDTYSHVLPSMQKSATEKIEQMLFERTGT